MNRTEYLYLLSEQLRVHPVCALLGPRQCGKTTLASQFAEEWTKSSVHRFDLENPEDLLALQNPISIHTTKY